MRRNTPTGRSSSIVFVVTLLVLILSPMRVSLAQGTGNSTLPDVSISGYLDVQAISRNASMESRNFQLGQLALDLAAPLNRRITAAMEIAYGYAENIAVGQAYVDWNLFRWDGHPRRPSLGTTLTGLKIGRFDVPFGIDWRSYHSIRRRLVTLPLVLLNTHRGWNDLGVQCYGETNWSNWSVYAVNGFGTTPTLRLPDRPGAPHLAADGDGEVGAQGSTIFPTEAFGARFGLNINSHIEFGTSFAAGYAEKNKQDERLFAFDFAATYDPFELRGEFISHERHRVAGGESVYGYYIEGAYSFGRWFGVLRQDTYRPDGSVVYPLGVIARSTVFSGSGGLGCRVGDNAQVRAEYQLMEGRSNDTVYLQTVVAF